VLVSHVLAEVEAWPSHVQLFLAALGRSRIRHYLNDLAMVGRFYVAIARQIGRTGRLLDRVNPDVIFLGEDNPVNDSGVWAKVARRRGIPTIVIPYTVADESESVYGIRRSASEEAHRLVGPLNRIVGRLFPRWTLEVDGKRYLREYGSKVLALHAHGLAPQRPWKFFSGGADAIATESHAMRDFLAKQGLQPEKLVLTGSAALDILARHRKKADADRAAVLERLGLEPTRPFILWGMTFDKLVPEDDFRDFDELVGFIAEELRRQTRYQVIVRPHPRVAYEDVRWIESDQLKLSQRDTAALLPLCELYIGTVSASMRWAIACGKPILDYDVYRCGITHFHTEGVVAVDTRLEFSRALARLVTDHDYLARLTERQEARQESWGILDGQSGERLVTLVNRLSTQYTSAA
jgi:hypothetical protein